MINDDAKYIGDADRGGDFEMLDISGDVGFRVRAASLPELFVKAGLACSALMVEPHGVQNVVSLDIEVEVVSQAGIVSQVGILSQNTTGADDGTLEELLVAWLNELIYRFDAEGFTAARITVLEFSPARIKTVVSGQHYDPQIHTPGLLVKAATHHGLKILKTNDTYLADIVLDI